VAAGKGPSTAATERAGVRAQRAWSQGAQEGGCSTRDQISCLDPSTFGLGRSGPRLVVDGAECSDLVRCSWWWPCVEGAAYRRSSWCLLL